jgi:cation:H+ antiporter
MLASIFPHVWFSGVSAPLLMLITVIAMAIVVKGADWLVEGAAGMAKVMGMPAVVIGATIVSLGTTSPEAAVSVLAAFNGQAGLALGNGVGSIIADTGLIFGIGCLMTRLPADKFVLSRQGWIQFGSAVLLAGCCYGLFFLDGEKAQIPRWIGIVFVALLVLYMALSMKWAKAHPAGEPHLIAKDGEVEHDRKTDKTHGMLYLVGLGLIGLVLVVLAGDGLVNSVTELAGRWGIPDVVIASTLVAFGTSLPELVVGITAIRKGHAELLVGNIIGADILNVLFVIGLAALAKPLPIIEPTATYPAIFLIVQLPTMLLMLVMFRLFIFRAVKDGSFSRWMGIPLLVLYVVFIVAGLVLS